MNPGKSYIKCNHKRRKETLAGKKPTIVIVTISDLFYEANLHRKVQTLLANGFKVRLFCAFNPKLNKDLWAPAELIQVKLWQKPTVLRFLQFWVKATAWLLKQKADLFISYDFLPLVALRIKSFFQENNYIYDSVELVIGLNSLVHKSVRRFFFKKIEQFGVASAQAAFTVCQSDAQALQKVYPKLNVVGFVRNIPLRQKHQRSMFLREKYDIAADKKIGLYQGMVFEGRGLIEILKACSKIDQVVLVIVGDGTLRSTLMTLAKQLKMENRVIFTGMVPFDQLAQYTYSADFGFTIISGKGLSYYHALPNKLFEYIQAEIPVIGSNYPEIRNLIEQEQVGFVVDPQNIGQIEQAIKKILDPMVYHRLKQNLKQAAPKYSWQEESKKYLQLITRQLIH